MSIALGAVRGLYKKRPNFEKCFFLRNDISQVPGRKFTKMISHLGNGSNSGGKFFFLKICIFRKVTGPAKNFVSKILSNAYFRPPPSQKSCSNLLNFFDFSKIFQMDPKHVGKGFRSRNFLF